MKKRKGLELTLEQADAHQRKHGFPSLLSGGGERTGSPEGVQPSVSRNSPSVRRKRRGEMNRIEHEFSLMLAAQKQDGMISRFEYEGLTLRWRDEKTGELMRYTPDFAVFAPFQLKNCPSDFDDAIKITLIEIKGNKFWERPLERFKHARSRFKEFDFECWQKLKDVGWTRLA